MDSATCAPLSFDGGFERSRCIVKLINGRLSRAGMRPFDEAMIESFAAFRSQCHDGAFLCLERRDKYVWKLLEIIQPGSILHEVHEIAFTKGLDFSFPEEVEAEVEAFTTRPLDVSDCTDLRSVPFVTVDGAGTRDLDQALYVANATDPVTITRRPDTHYVVYYAIADASWFVRPDSALFKTALERGTSMYFAGMSVPMLPSAFSRGLVSLNANVDRRALVFIMQIDGDGHCTETTLVRAVIHSFAKLTNEEVDKFLAAPEHHRFNSQPFANSLLRFQEVGELRRRESESRNVVQFNRVSLYTSLNPARTAFVLGLDERTRVDLYNEQLSLLCNMEGAKLLNKLAEKDPEVLAIFRNHEAPSSHAVDEVETQIADIVKSQNLDGAWIWDRAHQSLGDYLNNLPEDQPGSDRLFRIRQAIERAVLMMQRRSVFSPEAGLHSALGVNPYARFSAPMREIVGIFTHKEAVEGLISDAGALSLEDNAVLRNQVIDSANHAKTIQRDLDKAIDSCAIAHAIAQDYDIPLEKRPIRKGTILGMKTSALYVRLDMPPVELKVYLSDMQTVTGEGWSIDDSLTICTNKSGTKRYAVGDSVGIQVHAYQEQKQKWRVILV